MTTCSLVATHCCRSCTSPISTLISFLLVSRLLRETTRTSSNQSQPRLNDRYTVPCRVHTRHSLRSSISVDPGNVQQHNHCHEILTRTHLLCYTRLPQYTKTIIDTNVKRYKGAHTVQCIYSTTLSMHGIQLISGNTLNAWIGS